MDKLEIYHKKYIEVKESLEKMRTDELMGPIIEWFATTDANPHDWLPDDYINDFYHNIFSFYNIVRNIEHYLIDDGAVCFPIVENGNQMIYFMDSSDYIKLHGEPTQFVDDIYTFMDNVDQLHIDSIKETFIWDCASNRISMENLVIEYKKLYRFFDPAWQYDICIQKKIKQKITARKRLQEARERIDAKKLIEEQVNDKD